MRKKRVILVTGMSGAGKTSASSVLEDMGYHCIDQFPVQMLGLLSDLIETSIDPRFSNVALATSLKDFPAFFKNFDHENIDTRVLFLDASNDELLLRYKATRRTHPMMLSNVANTLEEAISVERALFKKTKETSFLAIDTTFLKSALLKQKMEQYFALSNVPMFSISFISFGYKHGVPLDADLMFDVRFLPNPYWDIELRPYSGDDPQVYNYVMNNPQTEEFCKRLLAFLDYGFEEYVKEGKNHFTVAIGCTGGQHRSVSITNFLYNHYKAQYNCYKEHRDKKGLENG